jgi:hypothetical protein
VIYTSGMSIRHTVRMPRGSTEEQDVLTRQWRCTRMGAAGK